MKRIFLLLTVAAALAGCSTDNKSATTESKTPTAGQAKTGIIDAETPESYQKSMEKLRGQLTDDRQLYEFVAAVGLLRSGADSADSFRTMMDGRTVTEVVDMTRKNGLDNLAASYAKRSKADDMRKGLIALAGENNVKHPARGEVVTIDTEHLYPSLAAMALSVDDTTLFRLTAALDVIMAMSLDQLDYSKKIAGRSAAELIAAGRADAFEAAVRKSMYTIPANLLRGELDESPEPENALRFDCSGEAVQSASLGRILASLDDTKTLEVMTAINMLRHRCQDEEKFNSILDKRSARELVNRMYRENPAEFIQEYGTLRLTYSDTDLAAIRAKYVAFSAVAANAPAAELQPPPQPKDAAGKQPVDNNQKQEQPAK
ncbi:MAG: hypothetical protein AB7F40_06690 [Victivallaceae bacterium]|nr:hypothetical protein [Victivallaceae bacterium]